MDRWSIYIDVEGFGSIYELNKDRALRALADLMEALFRIGSRVFCQAPERLFVHQFGDGFVIVSEFSEQTPDRALALAIAVMRHLLTKGVATKAAISGGDFADVFGTYPDEVQAATNSNRVAIGEGVMTINSVMGSALVSPHKLASMRSGAVLLLDSARFARIPSGAKIVARGGPTVIDWIHSDIPLVSDICSGAGLSNVAPTAAEALLRNYLNANRSLSKNWIESTLESVGMS
jgi:hypothetical protein